MKLKLEAQGDIRVLTVTEELTIQHAAILKVGLRKMFQTGVRKFVLDLTAIGPTTPDALRSVAAGARSDAEKAGLRLLVVSTLAQISDAPTTDKAVALLNESQAAPEDSLLEEEAQLKATLHKLQRRKAALEEHLSKMGSDDVRTLKKEYSDLATSVARLERVVTAIGTKRREPAMLSSSERKFRRVAEILTAVLEQEGVLPIK